MVGDGMVAPVTKVEGLKIYENMVNMGRLIQHTRHQMECKISQCFTCNCLKGTHEFVISLRFPSSMRTRQFVATSQCTCPFLSA